MNMAVISQRVRLTRFCVISSPAGITVPVQLAGTIAIMKAMKKPLTVQLRRCS
jgi:hypothetical protein